MIKQNEIPKQYEATGQDCFNYVAKYGTSNIQIQAVIALKEPVDEVRLKEAIRLSIDMEPVLGCRFVENEKKAYWERFENIEEIPWFTYEEREDQDKALDSFLKAPMGLGGQQQVEVKLIKSGAGTTVQKNIIGIKVNHACADAGGVKQYLYLLSELYTKLYENPEYKPTLEAGRRDQKYYFDTLGINEPMSLFDPKKTGSHPTWAFPYHGLELTKMHIALNRFKGERFKAIKAFAKEKGVTINTLLLTAFYRSMFEILKPEIGEKMEVYVTTDLRKFIPEGKKQDICNLSSMMTPRIERIDGEPFEKTLRRVDENMTALKKEDGGLPAAITMEAIGVIDYSHCLQVLQGGRQQAVESKKSSPLLSNVGVIAPLKFGEGYAEEAYIITPSLFAPGFMLGVSSYNDVLTLVASFYEPSTSKEDVEKLFSIIKEELENIVN